MTRENEQAAFTRNFRDSEDSCDIYVRLCKDPAGIRFVISSEVNGDCEVVLSSSDFKRLVEMLSEFRDAEEV